MARSTRTNSARQHASLAHRIRAALVWLVATLCVGLACGGGAVLLSLACDLAEKADRGFWLLPYTLPGCALITCLVYRVLGVSNDVTTAALFSRQRDGGPVVAELAPAILLGTSLSLLGGGSVGKEAGALQLGAAIGAQIERLGKRRASWAHGLAGARDTFMLAGMAAAFSALLFAPVAATLLVLEVAKPQGRKLMRWRTLCIPGAAAVGYALADLFDVGRLWGEWAQPSAEALAAVTPASLALLVGAALLVGILFVWLLKATRTATRKYIPAIWLRVLVGSALCVLLALLVGRAYTGTGDTQIVQALGGSGVSPDAFACKALLTICCLGFALRGGEVMPSLAIGACLGCTVASLTGADTALFAALGMMAVFATCSHSPLASFALGIEAFGLFAAPLLALAALVPGLLAFAIDAARLCREPADIRSYAANTTALAERRGKFSLGLFN
jgi:H+/Cl- antiporter ClcA